MRYNLTPYICEVIKRCGLVMNKDEIQLMSVALKPGSSCGLVMNKDEIQQNGCGVTHTLCCGLVMNKDEIQLVIFAMSFV